MIGDSTESPEVRAAAWCTLNHFSLDPHRMRPHPSCGAVASIHRITVDGYREMFFDDDEEGDSVHAQLRAHFGIRKLTPADAVVPIREPAVCHEWLPAILAAVRKEYGRADHGLEGYLFEMVRLGPYMVVLAGFDMDAVPPHINLEGSRISVYVFKVDGKRLLGRMLG